MWSPSPASFLLLAGVTGAFVVPPPTGQYNISLTLGGLTDYTREDPGSEVPAPRSVMLSVFEPIKCASLVPVDYMPKQTAEFQGPFLQAILDTDLDVTPLFLGAQFPVCSSQRQPRCQPSEEFPIIFFSPGYSIPVLYYNYMASALASQGFTVIAMDHPGDTNFIKYPDGHVSMNNDTVQGVDNILQRLPGRVQDMIFILDQMSNNTAMGELLPHRRQRPLPTDRVTVMGHSLGGIAAVIAAEKDSRFVSAINWDGSQLELPTNGVSQPTLLMRAINFETWPDLFPLLEGPALWVDIANATHFSFSDGPTLFQAIGEDPEPLASLLGTIAPQQMEKLLVDYTVTWLKQVLAPEGDASWDLVKELALEYPEITVVMESGL